MSASTNAQPAIAVHGGAGRILRGRLSPRRDAELRGAITRLLTAARQRLEQGAPALEVAQAAVMELEDDPLFNAGRGSALTTEGVVEMDAAQAADFGFQWQGLLGGSSGNRLVAGTNFGSGGNNIVDLAIDAPDGTVRPNVGLNIGLVRSFAGITTLAALARFLETKTGANILSTPNLVALDNEEAKIVIGQNVPFVTGSFTNTGSNNGSVNPFQTVERKDVGLTLRVKPQISENGTIKMQIFQEVSSVQASSVNSPTGLITNKRSIESNVLVEDGGIVVLGGLMQDEYSGNQEKVPFLGDVPILGNLFKTETRGRKRTNLMVFLRPVVIRDATASDSLSMDRYDLMRNAQKEAQPAPRTMLNINDAPVLANIGARSVLETNTLVVNLAATDVDNANVNLSISGPANTFQPFTTLVNNGNGTGSLTFNPKGIHAGTYNITVTASDGALTDFETFTLTVNEVGQIQVILGSTTITSSTSGSVTGTVDVTLNVPAGYNQGVAGFDSKVTKTSTPGLTFTGAIAGDDPLFVGDTVNIVTEVLELRESKSRPDAGIVTFRHEAYNQRSELVASCKRTGLQRKRPQG